MSQYRTKKRKAITQAPAAPSTITQLHAHAKRELAQAQYQARRATIRAQRLGVNAS